MIRLIYSLLIFSTLSLMGSERADLHRPNRFLIHYGSKPEIQDLTAWDLVILHPESTVNIETLHKAGTIALGYLSLIEIAPDASYRKKAIDAGIRFAAKNNVWKSDLVDPTSEIWRRFVLDELANSISALGYDGFFLDTVDSVDTLMSAAPQRAKDLRKATIDLIAALKQKFPNKVILSNRGYSLGTELNKHIDGMLVESVYQSHDITTNKPRAMTSQETDDLLKALEPVKQSGIPIYAVDYVSPSNHALAAETDTRLSKLGFKALVTTPELNGISLGARRQVPRRVTVLYHSGGTGKIENTSIWPSDTMTGQFLQLPLEWKGYAVYYHDLATGFPDLITEDLTAVWIVDGLTYLSESLQNRFSEWITNHKEAGKKIIFFGNFPFTTALSWKRVTQNLGFSGQHETVIEEKKIISPLIRSPELASGETTSIPSKGAYPVFKAGDKCNALVTARLKSKTDVEFSSDLIFSTPWGGVALQPALTLQRPDGISLWMIDPFSLLENFLGHTNFPVPDPDTENGLRVLTSHVDADGFRNMSLVEQGQRSAEIIRDRIFKRYPFPITCSIIESEIRGELKGQTSNEATELQRIARSIFSLPNIQIASHSYSHPFIWMSNDKTKNNYEASGLLLAPGFDKYQMTPEREIADSIRYIRTNLLPPNKDVELMLWTGNCRPGPKALDIVNKLGILNLNGGQTYMTKRAPTLTLTGPRLAWWAGRLQVNTPIQNDILFTNGFAGPLWGGYVNVIDTFEMTELPRRLKPVCIYYHLFGGDRPESLRALEHVYDWAESHPLHSLTAATYARRIIGTLSTCVFEEGSNRWIVTHNGDLRTLRIPASTKSVDLMESKGIIGWNDHAGFRYLISDGSPRLVVSLAESSVKPHLRLVSCTGNLTIHKFGAEHAEFTVSDFRPIKMQWTGIHPQSKWLLVLNGQSNRIQADREGFLNLNLPGIATVSLKMEAL